MVAYFQDTQALGYPGLGSFEAENLGLGAVGCEGKLRSMGSGYMPPASCAGAGRIHILEVSKGIGFLLWVEHHHHPTSLC
jgi:hypothetical protein